MFARRLLASAIAAAAMAGAVCAPPAFAQIPTENTRQSWNIPAGSLEDALSAFAAAAGVPLSFEPVLVAGKRSEGLRGDYSVGEGFERLLNGSGLIVAPQTNGTYTLKPRPAAAGPDVTLKAVSVTAAGEQESPIGPVKGYIARRSATGTKTDTPLLETPQSISVVTADEMALLKPQTLESALAYTAGVGVDGGGVDITGDSFILRGFRALAYYSSIYRNGMKFTVNIFDGQQEPYGLERLEVLKGASSLLYGTAAPGGIINSVSKQPTLDTLREINVDAGSNDRKQISGDFSGSLSDDGVWSGRLTVLKRDAQTSIDHVDDDREFVAPSLRWQPTENTSLTLLGYWQSDDSAYTGGYPASMFFSPDSLGKPSRHTFYGQPGASDYRSDRKVAGYLFDHRFNDTLRLRQGLTWYEAHTDYGFADVYDIDADQRTGFRYAQTRKDRAKSLTSDTSLEINVTTGALSHKALVGFDTVEQDFSTERHDWNIDPIDLYEPTYHAAVTDPQRNVGSGISETKRHGIYVQEQAKLGDKWVFVLGGRQEWSDYTDRPMFDPNDYPASDESEDAFTWRAGVVYLLGNGIAPFFSYATSFEPTPGRDFFNTRFDPTEGEQYELGVRYMPAYGNTLLTATVYELTQTNVLTPDADPAHHLDPTRPNPLVQTGEQRSRGLELEARTQIAEKFTLIGAYTYTDAKTTESNTEEEIGKQKVDVPYHQLSLWGGYDFAVMGVPGFSIGAGARYNSGKPASPNGVDMRLPEVTVIDAMLAFARDGWRLALNVSNLTDKTYLESCSYSCAYGEPRKVIGTASYRW